MGCSQSPREPFRMVGAIDEDGRQMVCDADGNEMFKVPYWFGNGYLMYQRDCQKFREQLRASDEAHHDVWMLDYHHSLKDAIEKRVPNEDDRKYLESLFVEAVQNQNAVCRELGRKIRGQEREILRLREEIFGKENERKASEIPTDHAMPRPWRVTIGKWGIRDLNIVDKEGNRICQIDECYPQERRESAELIVKAVNAYGGFPEESTELRDKRTDELVLRHSIKTFMSYLGEQIVGDIAAIADSEWNLCAGAKVAVSSYNAAEKRILDKIDWFNDHRKYLPEGFHVGNEDTFNADAVLAVRRKQTWMPEDVRGVLQKGVEA